MSKMIMAKFALLAALTSAQGAFAQMVPVPELGFKLGDDVSTVNLH